MWLGLAALGACATTQAPGSALEAALPAWANDPCERLAIPDESELPALSQDAEIAAAQLAERGFWTARDIGQEAVISRVCRQRNEATANIAAHNQLVREAD
jgi:hypothetical protein